MKRNIIFATFISLGMVLSLTACNSPSTPQNHVRILPEQCTLTIGKQMPLTLDGVVPPNAAIHWTASDGSILSTPPNLNALFTAPLKPAIVTITVGITSGTPDADAPVTRQCTIMPIDGPIIATSGGSNPNAPASTTQSTIAISEVMATPCGGDDFKKWNEYVELYNYGNSSVDVRGWWLFDPGPTGTPDSLVSWDERVPNAVPGPNLITNTTVIPPHKFAVILSPLYVQGIPPYQMPYHFPDNTIMLSIRDSDRLGDDVYGIVGTGLNPDFLVLYIGGSNSVLQVVSTYGNPTLGSYLQNFRDTPGDGLPLVTSSCWSVERKNPTGPDNFNNWVMLQNGSPGQAPYR